MLLRSLEVALSSACNLRCAYCYQRKGEVRRMSWPVLRAALDVLLASGAEEPEVGFMGGEPLLEAGLIRQAIAYLDERSPPGVRARLRMTTNGTLLEGRMVRVLALRRVRTFISFDGVASAQDARGKGSFAALDTLLARLRRDWPGWLDDDVTIGITLSSANVDHLAASVRYFLDKGLQSFTVSPLVTHDPGWKDGCFERLDVRLAEVYAACREHWRRTGEQPFWLFQRRRDWQKRRRRNVPLCRIGDGHAAFVDVDGEAALCGLLSRSFAMAPSELARRAAEAARLGPVTDPGLPGRLAAARRALAELRVFDGKERKRSPYRACARCPGWAYCHFCPMAIANQPGNEDPDAIPALPCALYLLAAKYRRRFPAIAR